MREGHASSKGVGVWKDSEEKYPCLHRPSVYNTVGSIPTGSLRTDQQVDKLCKH